MTIATALSSEQIAYELVLVLPHLNHIVARELRNKPGNESTLVQLRALNTLTEGPMTLSTLARKRDVSLQAASEQIQTLVNHGWVMRVPDLDDRRQALLQITDEGLKQLTEVREHIAKQFARFVERMSVEEAEAIYRGVLALQRAFEDETSD